MKFEYHCVSLPLNNGLDDTYYRDNTVRELGEQGWELVQIVYDTTGPPRGEFWFKRVKQ